jgi:hypothetical protein
VGHALSPRLREVSQPLFIFELGPTGRKDAQPSIQDRSAGRAGLSGGSSYETLFEGDAPFTVTRLCGRGPQAHGTRRGRPKSFCPPHTARQSGDVRSWLFHV